MSRSAAWLATVRPTFGAASEHQVVDPFDQRGAELGARATDDLEHVLGSPASSSSSSAASALKGVWLSALITAALPAASAGIASLVLSVSG